MTKIKRHHPIEIEREALNASLSLEALGLLVHLVGDKTREQIQQEFPEYDTDSLLAELIDAGFIQEIEDQAKEKSKGEPNVWVYVIQVGNAFKVGVTKSVKRRLKQYKTHAPSAPEVVWARRFYDGSLETKLHTQLRAYRSHGEWFHCERSFIDEVLDEYGPSEM